MFILNSNFDLKYWWKEADSTGFDAFEKTVFNNAIRDWKICTLTDSIDFRRKWVLSSSQNNSGIESKLFFTLDCFNVSLHALNMQINSNKIAVGTFHIQDGSVWFDLNINITFTRSILSSKPGTFSFLYDLKLF